MFWSVFGLFSSICTLFLFCSLPGILRTTAPSHLSFYRTKKQKNKMYILTWSVLCLVQMTLTMKVNRCQSVISPARNSKTKLTQPVISPRRPHDSWHLTFDKLHVNDVHEENKQSQRTWMGMRETNDGWNLVLTEGQLWLRDKECKADGRILSPLTMIFPIRSSSHYPSPLTLFQRWRIWWDICLRRRVGLTEESASGGY